MCCVTAGKGVNQLNSDVYKTMYLGSLECYYLASFASHLLSVKQTDKITLLISETKIQIV